MSATRVLARGPIHTPGRYFSARTSMSRALATMASADTFKTHRPSTEDAFVLKGIKNVVFEKRKTEHYFDNLRPNEVIVAPRATGICGSDVKYYKEGRVGEFIVKEPMVLGHESAGFIIAVGDRVKGLKPGDRVAIEPGETCGECVHCKAGNYQRCHAMIFAATPPYDGTLKTFYNLPHHLCYKLPDWLSLEEAALCEPLSVALHAILTTGQIKPNQNVLITGAGPVGLLAMAAAKALSARRIIAVDINESRLDFASNYAATDTFKPSPKQDGEGALVYATRQAKEMKDKLGLEEEGLEAIDLAIECSGAPSSVHLGVTGLTQGGTLVQVGTSQDMMDIPIMEVVHKEIRMKGSFRYGAGIYAQAVDLISQGKIDLKQLITHRYSFQDAGKAFADLTTGKGHDGKPAIKMIIEGPEY